MIHTGIAWRKLLLFCLGLVLGAAFCMKWMESDFWSNGEKFTIIGLEYFYPQEQLESIFRNLTPTVRASLKYHLAFDFAFMAGVYPGIASWCMIVSQKLSGHKILGALAFLQLLAWMADIMENLLLLRWIDGGTIFTYWTWYHPIVALKWFLALSGLVLPLLLLILGRRK